MKRTTLRSLAFGMVAMSAIAAEAQSLEGDMETLFGIADRNNTSIRSCRTAMERARQDVEAARAQRLPDVTASLSVSYIGTGQTLNRDFSYYMNPGFPHWGNSFALEAQQVVYSGGALTGGIRMAELGRAMEAHNEEGCREDVHMLLAGLYLQRLSLQNRLAVVERNVALADTLIGRTRSRYEEGVVLRNDITRYELMREQMALQKVVIEDRIKIVDKQLGTALYGGGDFSSQFIVHSSSAVPQAQGGTQSTVGEVQQGESRNNYAPSFARLRAPLEELCTVHCELNSPLWGELEGVDFPETYWQNLALTENSSLKKAATSIEMSRAQEKIARAASLPKVAVVAADNLSGPNMVNVPALDKNVNYWYVGVGVKYDISSIYKNRKTIRASRIATRNAEEKREVAREGISDGVHSAYMNMLTAQSELKTRRKSMELARQNYDVISNRYDNGLALVTDMTDAANVRLDAELQYVDAQISVALAYYTLKYVAGDI